MATSCSLPAPGPECDTFCRGAARPDRSDGPRPPVQRLHQPARPRRPGPADVRRPHVRRHRRRHRHRRLGMRERVARPLRCLSGLPQHLHRLHGHAGCCGPLAATCPPTNPPRTWCRTPGSPFYAASTGSRRARRCAPGFTGSWSTSPRPAASRTAGPCRLPTSCRTTPARPWTRPASGDPTTALPRALEAGASRLAVDGNRDRTAGGPVPDRARRSRPAATAAPRDHAARHRGLQFRGGLRDPRDLRGQPAGTSAPGPRRGAGAVGGVLQCSTVMSSSSW